MIKRFGYAVQLSYDVSDEEKAQAEKALIAFSHALKQIKVAEEHLNLMLTPFKDHNDISPEQVFKFRVQIREFRDKAIENFNNFKIHAFKCIVLMQKFSSDTQTVKLMKSFITGIDKLEKSVNDFAALFYDLKSKDFTKSAVDLITKIQKECDEVEKIISDRLINHVSENILSKTWIDSVSDELKTKLEPSKPLILELLEQKQKL